MSKMDSNNCDTVHIDPSTPHGGFCKDFVKKSSGRQITKYSWANTHKTNYGNRLVPVNCPSKCAKWTLKIMRLYVLLPKSLRRVLQKFHKEVICKPYHQNIFGLIHMKNWYNCQILVNCPLNAQNKLQILWDCMLSSPNSLWWVL